MKNNRRDFIKLAGMAGFGFTGINILTANAEIAGSENPTLPDEAIKPFNRFPRMIHDYFEKKAGFFEENSAGKCASLKTKQDVENYILDIRSKIAQCFGRWPDKIPLNARVTGIIERDAYKIEKVIFDSKPGFQQFILIVLQTKGNIVKAFLRC